jgi:hypothetical protein
MTREQAILEIILSPSHIYKPSDFKFNSDWDVMQVHKWVVTKNLERFPYGGKHDDTT